MLLSSPLLRLPPTGNANGSVHFFLLKTRRVVVRDKFIVIEKIPDAIVARINDIARGEMKATSLAW
jgi:hypothetical protein